MPNHPGRIDRRSAKEKKVVADFEQWLRDRGLNPTKIQPVGSTLVGEAQARAEGAIPPHSGDIKGVSFGHYRKANWFLGRIDVSWDEDGVEWIAEVKDEFTISKATTAVGQVLVYGDLAVMDEPLRGGLRRAVVFGSIPGGLIEDAPASHSNEILSGFARIFEPYGVIVNLEHPDESFRRVGAPKS